MPELGSVHAVIPVTDTEALVVGTDDEVLVRVDLERRSVARLSADEIDWPNSLLGEHDVTTGDGEVRCVDRATGQLMWTWHHRAVCDHELVGFPGIAGAVAVQVCSGRLHGIDLKNGDVIWEQPVRRPSQVDVWMGRAAVMSASDTLHVFKSGTGEQVARVNGDRRFVVADRPTLLDSLVLVQRRVGGLAGLDLETGRVCLRIGGDSPFIRRTRLSDGAIGMQTASVSVREGDGRLRWSRSGIASLNSIGGYIRGRAKGVAWIAALDLKTGEATNRRPLDDDLLPLTPWACGCAWMTYPTGVALVRV